jgi:hypothetical protein
MPTSQPFSDCRVVRVVLRVLPAAAACLAALACCGVQSASAQVADTREDVAALRREVAALRQELQALKQIVEGRAPEPSAPAEDLAAQVPLLQSQVAELAQTKVESASKFPVRLSGTLLANAFVNSGDANWLENPNIVEAARSGSGSHSTTLRQTRIGLAVDGPSIGGARTNAVLAFDFFGGVPGFQTGTVMGLPRLLFAFARIEGSRTALEVGQDQMVLAPRDPTSLAAQAFPALFRSGNLYLRVPQVRVEQQLGGGLSAAGAIVAPIAGDFGANYVFAPAAGVGERSRTPAVQARLAWQRGSGDEGRELGLGVSGHYGRERSMGQSASNWAGAVDFTATAGRLGVGGEGYYGKNIDAFGGASGQQARAAGGFAEVRFAATPLVGINVGFGLDRVPDRDRLIAVRRENRTLFGNTIVQLTPEVAVSFEYRWLETTWRVPEATRRNHHFDWVFAYSF